MPFKSKAQQRYMYAKDPEMAREFAAETPDFKALPEKVESKDEKKKRVKKAFELFQARASESLVGEERARADAFKVGFLRKLAEEGYTPEQFQEYVKTAFAEDFLSSVFNRGADAGSSLLGAGIGAAGSALSTAGQAAMVAPLAIGGTLGAGQALLNAPTVQDIEMLRKMELLAQYDRLSKEIKQRLAHRAGVQA